jgi:hypothetical protein
VHKEELDEAVADAVKGMVKDSGKFDGYATPEERMIAVELLLDKKVDSGEITSSEFREFKDVFNLKQKDQDITINQADFRAVDPEGADIIKAVNWQIKVFNEDQ